MATENNFSLLDLEGKLSQVDTQNLSTLLNQIRQIPSERPQKIVKIDLNAPQAEEKIRLLVENSNFLKVLAINGSDRNSLLKAIAAGAAGSTHQEITSKQMELVKQSIEQNCVLIDSKRLQNPHFLVLPPSQIAPKLERYQKGVELEIFESWRTHSFSASILDERWNLSNLAESLQQGSEQVSLIEEFSKILKQLSLKKTHRSSVGLEIIFNYCQMWYFNPKNFVRQNEVPNCCLAVLRTNAYSIKQALCSRLQSSLQLGEKTGGSYTFSQWLVDAIARLRKLEVNWELSRRENLRKAELAQNSYNGLWQKFKQEETKLGPKEKQLLSESVTRAIELHFHKLINAEAQSLAGQIIHELICELLLFKEKIVATDTIIYQIQGDLQHQLNSLLSSSLGEVPWTEEEIEQFEPVFNELKAKLIEKLGTFSNWGYLSKSQHKIILEEVSQQAQKIAWELLLSKY